MLTLHHNKSTLISVDEAQEYLDSAACFKDERSRILCKNTLKILKSNCILESQDFMTVFKNSGCKPRDVGNFLAFFLESNNFQKFDADTIYKRRSFRESNRCFKNFIITLIAYTYPLQLIMALKLHYSNYLPSIKNIDTFIGEIQEKIKKIKGNSSNIQIQMDSSLSLENIEKVRQNEELPFDIMEEIPFCDLHTPLDDDFISYNENIDLYGYDSNY